MLRGAAYIPESERKDYDNLKKWLCRIIMQPSDEQMVANQARIVPFVVVFRQIKTQNFSSTQHFYELFTDVFVHETQVTAVVSW